MTAPPQHKQRYYYIFWSIATLAVVCAQIYVASSYKSLAEALRLTLLWINLKENYWNFNLKHKTVYLERRHWKLLKRVRNGMRKPELLHTSPLGATVHSYDLTGGKSTFERFLGCYLGSCTFYDTYEQACIAVSQQELVPFNFWHNFVKPISWDSRDSFPPKGSRRFCL